MGAERRRDPRIRCSFPCTVRVAGHSLEGKVRNVSASGLAVAVEAPELDQGDSVAVTLRAEGLDIEVRALVWHVRSSGRATGDKSARVFGLVLSDSAPEFARLVERIGAKPAQASSTPSAPSAAAPASPAGAIRPSPRGLIAPARPPARRVTSESARTREYRIRIKQSGGPRTCQIVASGASKEAAVEAALREVGRGWIVLEVIPVA